MSSLLKQITYEEYKKALALPKEQCEYIADFTRLKIKFDDGPQTPGEQLVKALDRRGLDKMHYESLVELAQTIPKNAPKRCTPVAKYAILIANDKYEHLAKLATPSADIDALASLLKKFNFVVITLKNMSSRKLKDALSMIFSNTPKKSYIFMFYGGHGCQIYNVKCMLCVDCPNQNIELKHCITENFMLQEAAKLQPELCVFIMDMCQLTLDRSSNPKIYADFPTKEDYTMSGSLLIAYSTQNAQAAYEMLQIECSSTIEQNVSYELKTGDTSKIVPGNSLYVNALCKRLAEIDIPTNVNSMLDKVHRDVEKKSSKNQRPIKVQCGCDSVTKNLHDIPEEGAAPFAKIVQNVLQVYKDVTVL